MKYITEDESKLPESPSKIRRRANLNHLSQEEKQHRRKLKNRVAAQSARDKKKLKIDEMESTIRQLEGKLNRLIDENQKIIDEKEQLRIENERLRSAMETNVEICLTKDEEVSQFIQLDDSAPVQDSLVKDDETLLNCPSACDRPSVPAEPIQVLQLKG